MYLDVKVTAWQRIKLDDDATKERVINHLKENSHSSLFDDGIAYDYETLTDTEEQVTVEDNKGFSTLELYNEDGELLWANGTVYI